MATAANPSAPGAAQRRKSIAPDLVERLLAIGALAMLAAVLAAIARGHDRWMEVPAIIWFHLITIVAALALTPFLLLQRRGTRLHRRLGWAWAAAMVATAIASFFIRRHNGGFSWIHILSLVTLIGVPMIVYAARSHRVAAHRMGVRIAVSGALLIAGSFTFPFNRLLGRWLLG